MLVQDTLTGALHEVPDVSGYAEAPGYGYYAEPTEFGYYGDGSETVMGGQVYDGLGNPVGFLPFLGPIVSALAPLAAKALPAVTNLIPGIAKAIPGVSQLVGGLLPGGGAPAQAAPPPGVPPQMMPPAPMGAVGSPFPFANPMFPRPVPPGWMQQPPGYQGGHRRYMRCVSWPGPPGLVPMNAGAPGAPMVPAAPAASIVAAAQVPVRRVHRRFHRR